MSPLRVALLTYRGKPHCGGQGVYTRHLSTALSDLGHHVEVFSGQPYPVLDERVVLHKLPSLDMWERYPWFLKSLTDVRDRIDLGEFARTAFTGTFAEPWGFSKRAERALLKRLGDFGVVHDNQCRATGLRASKWPGLPALG